MTADQSVPGGERLLEIHMSSRHRRRHDDGRVNKKRWMLLEKQMDAVFFLVLLSEGKQSAIDSIGRGQKRVIDSFWLSIARVSTRRLNFISNQLMEPAAVGNESISMSFINPLNGKNISAECFENGLSVAT
ncbi:hypothetical protein AVEN_88951-1 [Araneus ventricosus]|uniref:Uncharacterized protein n=1 Tax=Araneus ventricosus TaxID=182803 RepID=A0A4Y2DK67_ARAVE|nr:hypothetical protein AVEN_88951-1 [Araneus ventricosus]